MLAWRYQIGQHFLSPGQLCSSYQGERAFSASKAAPILTLHCRCPAAISAVHVLLGASRSFPFKEGGGREKGGGIPPKIGFGPGSIMDIRGPIRFRSSSASSSSAHHRFLGSFSPLNPSPPSPSNAAAAAADDDDDDDADDDGDLCEDDIFSAVDFSVAAEHRGGNGLSGQVPAASSPRRRDRHLGRHGNSGFVPPDGFGILAALPEREASSVLGRKASVSPSSSLSAAVAAAPVSSSRMIPAIPRPPQDRFPRAHFSSAEQYHQSAPVNVPVLMARRQREFVEVEDENGDGDDEKDFDGEEMLPPHEIVARRLSRSQSVACSVLEGAGRTLKGRDLHRVRNTVWRQTGFLD
ncbi:hypothetical protein NL676_031245 [Syzygium grande]|nr:hypothetical protein NL676_031245 [Syzygium grande]